MINPITNEILNLIHPDCISIILQYSPAGKLLLEILAMSRSKNRRKKSLISNKILKNVNDELCNRVTNKLRDILKDNYLSFIDELEKSSSIIAGSFILHCLMEEIPYDDIDIYTIGYPQQTMMRSYMNQHAQYHPASNSSSPLSVWNSYNSSGCKDTFRSIKCIENFSIPKMGSETEEQELFQLIHCRDQYYYHDDRVISIREKLGSIIEKTDYKCAMNYFDGRTLTIKHPQSILNKKIEIDRVGARHPAFLLYRWAKYISKGFIGDFKHSSKDVDFYDLEANKLKIPRHYNNIRNSKPLEWLIGHGFARAEYNDYYRGSRWIKPIKIITDKFLFTSESSEMFQFVD